METPIIYSLFIAINKYENIRNLNGCLNDADNLAQYIQEATKAQNRQVRHKKLYNEQATKRNIINTFMKHLGQAKERDICLFYFSGHGGQEEAPAVFAQYEPDGKLEVLACQDSDHNKLGSFLADKELAYLIYQLYQKTKAEIITIFDCCSSGENTRLKYEVRRLSDNAPRRNWEDFIFHEHIAKQTILPTTKFDDILPQGHHIHLAACEDKQSAYERSGHGIFTSNLIFLLRQTKGNISYSDLVSILRLKILGAYKQTPQLFSKGNAQMIHRHFLGGLTKHQRSEVNLVYNGTKNNWMIDLGAIHGLSNTNSNIRIALKDNPNQSITMGKISPDNTTVFIDEQAQLDKKLTYKANVQGLTLNSLKITCIGEDSGRALFKQLFSKWQDKTNGLELVNETASSDYIIQATSGIYSILSPIHNLPVTQTYKGYEEHNVKNLIFDLQAIAQWTFVKNLNNPNSTIFPNPPLEIKIFNVLKNGEEALLPVANKEIIVPYTFIPDTPDERNAPTGKIKIQIKNITNSPYYCALLFLQPNFGIYTNLIEGNTIKLPPQKEVWVWEGGIIDLKQEAYIRNFNWEKETDYLKLIVSTQFFDITSLHQDGLALPSVEMEKPGLTRGVRTRHVATLNDWISQLITINIPNPYWRV